MINPCRQIKLDLAAYDYSMSYSKAQLQTAVELGLDEMARRFDEASWEEKTTIPIGIWRDSFGEDDSIIHMTADEFKTVCETALTY